MTGIIDKLAYQPCRQGQGQGQGQQRTLNIQAIT